MGLFEKIKNALFEEEEVIVDEKPKKPKKEILKGRDVERPIAKKVVLPEKKDVKVEELEEDELLDEDFEIKPREDVEEAPVVDKMDFEMPEESDFRVPQERQYRHSEPEIVKVIDEEPVSYSEANFYQGRTEKTVYGMSEANKVAMPEYGRSSYDTSSYGSTGVYEKKEDRTHFKPSPIISPIYGILDKNYKKEDVVTKKEVRLTSSYARENLSVEDVRKKAYGSLSDDIAKEIEEPKKHTTFEVEEKVQDEANLLVDLSEDDKPTVKEVTMGDALEYFEDLGLEYNVDYVDATKAPTGRRTRDSYDDDVILSEAKEETTEEVKEEVTPVEEIHPTKAEIMESEDNLFDLIDSMYKEND